MVEYNKIHDCYRPLAGGERGIHLDDRIDRATVRGNLVHGLMAGSANRVQAITAKGGDHVVDNNIFVLDRSDAGATIRSAPPPCLPSLLM